MRYHHQNLSDGRRPLWRHGRAWLGSMGWEWSVFHWRNPSLSIGRWSFGIALFFISFSIYPHAADFFSRRELRVYWMDGNLWIGHPWERSDGSWRSADPWWMKPIVLHVVDWLIGRSRCLETKGASFEVFIPMPEGSYRATATPETRVWKRRWYWPQQRRDSVWLNIPGGIGHAGKGESDYDGGDDALCGIGGETVEKAIANAVASALKDRRRYGHDSAGTGREPALVINHRAATEGRP